MPGHHRRNSTSFCTISDFDDQRLSPVTRPTRTKTLFRRCRVGCVEALTTALWEGNDAPRIRDDQEEWRRHKMEFETFEWNGILRSAEMIYFVDL